MADEIFKKAVNRGDGFGHESVDHRYYVLIVPDPPRINVKLVTPDFL